MPEIAWIAVDWGSTQLRAWAMAADGEVLQSASSKRGMLALAPDQFEPALLELLEAWLPATGVMTVLACGMVGARQGWIEAPYSKVPCQPLNVRSFVTAPTASARLKVYVLPGLSQAMPADVMRGEETLIAGVLELQPEFEGVICLPGTHCKWARISQGRVEGFQTFMTGELFALLADHSVLKHGLGTPEDDPLSHLPAFMVACRGALERPEQLPAELFALRAKGLLEGMSPSTARASLSGLLIGSELAACRDLWGELPVVIVGDSGLAALYAEALVDQGRTPQMFNAQAVALAGLQAARVLIGIEV